VDYWEFISTQKHPVMAGKQKLIEQVLADPEEIRRSKKDANVFLFYRATANGDRYFCAVSKDTKDGSGFLMTAYITDAIKIGEVIWTKSK
jgi:hypothetical protein